MKTWSTWTFVIAAALMVGCVGQAAEGAISESLVDDVRVPEPQWRAIDPVACGDAEGVTGYRRAEGADELVVGVDALGALRCIDTLARRPQERVSRDQVRLARTRAVDPEPQPMLQGPHGTLSIDGSPRVPRP